jgi:hypothetical protein
VTIAVVIWSLHAVFLAAAAIVLFLLFSGYLTD